MPGPLSYPLVFAGLGVRVLAALLVLAGVGLGVVGMAFNFVGNMLP